MVARRELPPHGRPDAGLSILSTVIIAKGLGLLRAAGVGVATGAIRD